MASCPVQELLPARHWQNLSRAGVNDVVVVEIFMAIPVTSSMGLGRSGGTVGCALSTGC